MNCDELQLLAALEALGAIDAADAERWRARLSQDELAATESARFHAVITSLVAGLPRREPSPEVKARIMEKISTNPRPASHRPEPGLRPLPEGFRIIRETDPLWRTGPIAGSRIKPLALDPRRSYALLLVDLAPGARHPEHDHPGCEELFVLSGDLHTEGRRLGPGDFLHAEPGTHHGELYTVEGCRALMVVPSETLRALGSS